MTPNPKCLNLATTIAGALMLALAVYPEPRPELIGAALVLFGVRAPCRDLAAARAAT